MGEWWTASDKGHFFPGNVNNDVRVDEQCHLTNLGEPRGLEIFGNIKNYLRTNILLRSSLALLKYATSKAVIYLTTESKSSPGKNN